MNTPQAKTEQRHSIKPSKQLDAGHGDRAQKKRHLVERKIMGSKHKKEKENEQLSHPPSGSNLSELRNRENG